MQEQQQPIDVRHYVHVVYKRRHLFMLTTAGIIALSIAVSYLRPVVYEASTTVSIARNYLNVLMRDIAVTSSLEQQRQALSIMMTSRGMLQHVLGDLGVDLAAKSDAEVDGMLKYFQKRTHISFDLNRASVQDADIFTVTYRDRDPRFARDYVNALVSRYAVESMSAKREEAAGANRFLSEQLELYKRKIDRTERQLAEQQKQYGSQSAAHLAELQRRYNELLVQYTNKHPEAERLKDEIDTIWRQIRAQEGTAAQDGTIGREKITDEKNEKNIADLERDQEAYKKVYESLIASLGKSEVSSQVESKSKAGMFNILEPATLPMKPVSKPRWLIMLMGLMAGFVGGVAAAVLADMMDRSIKNVDKLKEFGLPVIGIIPRIQSVDAIVAARKKDLIAYGFSGMYLAVAVILIVLEYFR
jgi:succinoglycan biosynthesis transport protein ExoP